MKYMTIEREYGSGGTKIARELAKECRIPCYGQEILELASKKLQMPTEEIRANEEKSTGSLLYGVFMFSQAAAGKDEMLTSAGKIYVEEQSAIRELAKNGKAVFLGHCASEALKEYKDVIKVYIYADADTRKKRIYEDYGIAEDEVEIAARKNNRRRSNYYTVNTMKKWDDFRNYDIVLNSSQLGIEGCVKILSACF